MSKGLKKLASDMANLPAHEQAVILTKIARDVALGKRMISVEVPAHTRTINGQQVQIKAHTRQVDVPDGTLKMKNKQNVGVGATIGAAAGALGGGVLGAAAGGLVGGGLTYASNLLTAGSRSRRNKTVSEINRTGKTSLSSLESGGLRGVTGAVNRALNQEYGGGTKAPKAAKPPKAPKAASGGIAALATKKTGYNNPLKAIDHMKDGDMSDDDIRGFWAESGLSGKEADDLMAEYNKPPKR